VKKNENQSTFAEVIGKYRVVFYETRCTYQANTMITYLLLTGVFSSQNGKNASAARAAGELTTLPTPLAGLTGGDKKEEGEEGWGIGAMCPSSFRSVSVEDGSRRASSTVTG